MFPCATRSAAALSEESYSSLDDGVEREYTGDFVRWIARVQSARWVFTRNLGVLERGEIGQSLQIPALVADPTNQLDRPVSDAQDGIDGAQGIASSYNAIQGRTRQGNQGENESRELTFSHRTSRICSDQICRR